MDQFNNKIKFSLNINVKDGKKEYKGIPKKWNELENSVIKKSHKFLAILTGQKNGITIIDFDKKKGMEYFNKYEDLIKNTFIETSYSGYKHAYFEYDEDLNSVINLNDTSIDILNNGKCCNMGTVNNGNQITKIPQEFKDFLLKKNTPLIDEIETLAEDEDFFNPEFDEVPNEILEFNEVNNDIHSETSVDTLTEYTNTSIEDINYILSNLKIKRCDNRKDWLDIGLILFNELDNEGLVLFDNFSKNWSKYRGFDDIKETWKTFKKDSSKKIQLGSLYQMLKDDNIKAFNKLLKNKKKNKCNELITFKSSKSDLDAIKIQRNSEALYDDILDILPKDKKKIWTYEELFIFLAQRIRYFEKKDCWLIRNVETTTKKDYKTNKVEVINTVKDDFIQKICKYDDFIIQFIEKNNFINLKSSKDLPDLISLYKNNLVINLYDVIPYSPVNPFNFDNNKYYNGYEDKIGNKYYDKDLIIDESLFKLIIFHMKNIICNNDITLYDYFIKYVAFIVQNPNFKTEVALIFISIVNGSGKSFMFDILSKILNYTISTTMEKIICRFNTLGSRKNLICLEEIEKGCTNKSVEILKNLITQKQNTEERKGVDSITINDFTNYIFCTNNINCLRIEKNDRRYCVFDINTEKVGDFEYFGNLADEILNDNVIKHFYNYLIRIDLSKFNVKKMPDTDIKNEMKEMYKSPFVSFIEDLNEGNGIIKFDDEENSGDENILKFKDYKLTTAEIYDLYKEYMNNNHPGGRVDNSTRFLLKITKIYEKTRTNKQRGYIIKYLNKEELNSID